MYVSIPIDDIMNKDFQSSTVKIKGNSNRCGVRKVDTFRNCKNRI